MSNLSDSPSNTSKSESESSFIDEVVRKLAEFAPYNDSVEPLATEEEAVANNTQVHQRRRRAAVSTKVFSRGGS